MPSSVSGFLFFLLFLVYITFTYITIRPKPDILSSSSNRESEQPTEKLDDKHSHGHESNTGNKLTTIYLFPLDYHNISSTIMRIQEELTNITW